MDQIPFGSIQQGDVLLFHSEGFVSWAIRFVDGTDWNHAAFVYDPTTAVQIDAGTTVQKLDLKTRVDASDVDYVGVSRLKSAPAQWQPLDTRADFYLNSTTRYDYEAIVLLALLCTTRRLPFPALLKPMIRSLLDAAAAWLVKITNAGEVCMICSDLVYRCYNEALPASDDIYTIRVSSPPGQVAITSAAIQGRVHANGHGLSPHSLVARRAAHHLTASNPSQAAAISLAGTDDFTAAKRQTEVEIEKLQKRIQSGVAPANAGAIDDLASDPDIAARLDRFVAVHADHIQGKGFSASVVPMAAYARFSDTVSAFVTPGDLSKSTDLNPIGKYQK
jgi:hypothetical protein